MRRAEAWVARLFSEAVSTNARRLPNAKWHILKEDNHTPDKPNVVRMT